MRRAERLRWMLALLAALWLAGCGSSPKPPPQPRLRLQAQDAEANGARRYAQGDYAAAARHFAAAARLRLSLDDVHGAARNRLQLAQAELSLGQTQLALEHASEVQDASLQMQARLLQAQALLALGRVPAADGLLAQMATSCAARCAERGRLRLLQARSSWAKGQAVETATQAEAARPWLREQGEEREVANASRLLAASRLQLADTAAALNAAQAALEIDRQLALPEKIARDWLLIGDIHRRAASAEAGPAYQRAQAVAQAAGLKELAQLAEQSIKEKESAR